MGEAKGHFLDAWTCVVEIWKPNKPSADDPTMR